MAADDVDEIANDHASKFLSKATLNIDASFRTVAVLPGDNVTSLVTGLRKNIKLGAGLHQVGDMVFSSAAGALRYRAPITYWVEGDKKMYVPRVSDQVVGIIEEKMGEFYRVNIFSSSSALLNKLAFEGATKRNKPELKKGDVLYLRVSIADKDLDTEVTCITSSGSKKEWSTGETVTYVFSFLHLDC
jgi:exosome complex component RRP40